VFKINKKVPFSEARYITIKKNWVNDYPDALYIGKKDINTVLNAGKNAGLNGYIEDGKLYFVYPEVWTAASSSFCDEYGVRFMKLDINNNEIRPAAFQKAKWDTYNMTDSMGYFTEPFEFVLEEGENVISLEGKNARLAISHIILTPAEDQMTYEQYKAKYAGKPRGEGSIKLEAEYTHSASDKTIYPIEDSANAMTSPHDPSRVLLNTVGGEKWQTAGQSVSYKFSVDKSGMYDIVSRFNQSVLDGMFVNRSLYIYSEGLEEGADGYYNGIPFAEAKTLTYNYDDNWQVTEATDGNTEGGFEFYFEAGVVYTIKFEVTLGAMSEIINDVQSALDHINSDYLSIIQLTGLTPDTYRDYGFSRIMPDVLIDMVSQAYVLNNEDPDPAKWGVAQKLTALAGQKSSNVATLQKVSDLLLEMGRDEDEIARLLERLKSYIGTLGTFLSSAKTQPLQLDYVMIQGTGEEKPRAQANFWDTFIHEIKRFYYSFTRDYNNVGKLVETDEDSLQVWLATGRDQSQVKRNLINNDFTPNTGIAVDLKLVAGGTLLPSILANKGPDVYLGLGQGGVINYAIRSAILPIEEFPDFKEVTKSFNESAMTVLSMADPDGVTHYYGLPESQGFAMMFVRVDILADLGIDIPQTWDDIMAAIPKLQAKNMQMGLTTDSQIHLYQMGGELFADNGMRINLDSQVGLAAFKKTCELFTKYSFPYSYDAANRFRTGEMPILIGDYTGLYNQLKVFATEIEGALVMVPVPGVRQEDGSINNKAISSVSASVLVKGCEDQKNNAWEYIKWFTGDYCQTEYANEMVALLGPSAKYPTANINALERLPWTVEELARIKAQFNNLATVPNYPGAYIVGRYTEFAFLAAYNDGEDPAQAILGYIYNINKEITRKRTEFGLETLEQGETLASKRIGQAKAAAQELKSRSSAYSAIYDKVEFACRSKDTAVLYSLAEEIMTQTSVDTKVVISRGPDITKLSEKQLMYYIAVALEHAADALLTY
jgi:ABC-type glycerol-3-phosphate transport system substrate-binding protein